MTTKTCLYTYYNESGTIIYIGISKSAIARLSQHQAKDWGHKIAKSEMKYFDTREEAKIAEKAAIREHRPFYNENHTGKYRIPKLKEFYNKKQAAKYVGISEEDFQRYHFYGHFASHDLIVGTGYIFCRKELERFKGELGI